MANMYKGFSTISGDKKFRLVDFELVKQDLINHFNIRKGEKLMNPNFGTIIWNMLFDPLTDELKSLILSDIKTIISSDPRISVDNVIITEYLQGIQIELHLRYLLTNQSSVMSLLFNNTTQKLTAI